MAPVPPPGNPLAYAFGQSPVPPPSPGQMSPETWEAIASTLAPSGVPGMRAQMAGVEEGLRSVPGIGNMLAGAARAGVFAPVEQGMAAPAAGAPPPAATPPPGTDPELLAALRGGAARSGGGGTASSTTKLGRPQDVEYLKGERAAGEQLASSQAGVTDRLSQVNALHDQTIRDWAQEAKGAHARFGEAGKEMASEYRTTAAELKVARDQLKAAKVDPTRLWDSMPTTQKVLMAIGSLAGGFAEGVSGGKMQNDVGRWWDQAVTRDIEQQRDAIKAKMNEVELGTKEREEVWKKWQQSEDQIRTAAGRASQLELSRLSLATEDVKLKGELAKSITDIGSRVRAAEHGEFVAAQGSTTKTYSSGGGAGAGGGGGATLENIGRARAYEKARDSAREVLAIQERHKGGVPLAGADLTRWKQARDEAIYYRAQARGLEPKAAKQMMAIEREGWEQPGTLARAFSTESERVMAGDSARNARDIEEEARTFWASMAAGKAKSKKKGK